MGSYGPQKEQETQNEQKDEERSAQKAVVIFIVDVVEAGPHLS